MGKFILLVIVVAVAIFLITRLIETRGRLFSASADRPLLRTPRKRPPSGPIGPDDDPEFLRDLNRRGPKGPGGGRGGDG